jgi:hypothetical protein
LVSLEHDGQRATGAIPLDGERLVHQQHGRLVRDRAGDRDAPSTRSATTSNAASAHRSTAGREE